MIDIICLPIVFINFPFKYCPDKLLKMLEAHWEDYQHEKHMEYSSHSIVTVQSLNNAIVLNQARIKYFP